MTFLKLNANVTKNICKYRTLTIMLNNYLLKLKDGGHEYASLGITSYNVILAGFFLFHYFIIMYV